MIDSVTEFLISAVGVIGMIFSFIDSIKGDTILLLIILGLLIARLPPRKNKHY